MFLEIDGNKVFALTFGKGPRTFLAHSGWVGNFEDWIDVLGPMSANWRTAVYDHRGAGETFVSPDKISNEALVDDVFRVMDAMKIDRCVIGGFSRGTVTVLQAVIRDPSRFDGLVLMNGAAGIQPPNTPPRPAGGLARFPGETFHEKLRWFMKTCTPELDSEHIRRWGVTVLGRSTPEAADVLLQITAPKSLDFAVELPKLRLPTLLIHGDKDAFCDEASMRYLQSIIPDSELVIFEGSGHLPAMVRPSEVHSAIEAFFRTRLD